MKSFTYFLTFLKFLTPKSSSSEVEPCTLNLRHFSLHCQTLAKAFNHHWISLRILKTLLLGFIVGPDWLAALLQCNTEEKNRTWSILQLRAATHVKTAELCTAKLVCSSFHLQVCAHRLLMSTSCWHWKIVIRFLFTVQEIDILRCLSDSVSHTIVASVDFPPYAYKLWILQQWPYF